MRFPFVVLPTHLVQGLLDQWPDEEGVLVLSPTGRILAANQAAVRWTGYPSQELLRTPLERLFPPEQRHEEHWLCRPPEGPGQPMQASEILLEGGYRLIRFRPWSPPPSVVPVETFASLHSAFQEILDLILRPPEEFVLRLSLEKILQATQAHWAALYWAGTPAWHLQAGAGQLPDLPTHLSLQEAQQYLSPTLWHARNRQELPRGGLGAVLRACPGSFTVAVGHPEAAIGFLVAGFAQRPEPPEQAVATLQTYAALLDKWHQWHRGLQKAQRYLVQQGGKAALGELLWHYIPFPAFLVDEQGTILTANVHIAKRLGYQPEEVMGLALDQVVVCQDESSLQPHLNKVLRPHESGTVVHIRDTQVFHRSGYTFPGSIHLIPYTTPKERRAVVLIEDRTQYHESHILQRQALLGTLLAGYAHEVRNPLNNLMTGVDLLDLSIEKLDSAEREALREVLQRMRDDLDRLVEMSARLLKYAHPKHDAERREVPLRDLLQTLLDRWQPRFQKHGIETHLQAPEEAHTLTVWGDPIALEQAFANLIDNAIRALQNHPLPRGIYLRLEPHNRHIEVVVADTGPGIPEEIQQRIFEPFFTTRRDGHGLGLSLVRKIITDHHGSISLESFPGQGTLFRVRLPLHTGH